MTTFITINKHVIAANAKHGRNDPPIRVAKSKNGKAVYARGVKINGPSELISGDGKPVLKCGARIALVTDADVEVIA